MNKYGMNREEEIKEEIRWAEGKINYYTNKIYKRKLKLENKKQKLKSLIENTQATEFSGNDTLIKEINNKILNEFKKLHIKQSKNKKSKDGENINGNKNC